MYALALAVGLTSSATAGPVAYVGATVHTVSGEVVSNATLVVEGGKIVVVGSSDSVTTPQDAVVVDVAGKHIIPGLVDTHSHIGTTGDLNEGSGPLQPSLSAIDSMDASHPSFQRAQAGGVTTANIMPGSGNLMGGQTAYVKLRDVHTIDEMLLCSDRRTEICGGMKMANGTNSRRGNGGYPGTRMASADKQRTLFLEAQKYAKELEKKKDGGEGKKKKKKGASDEPDEAGVALKKRNYGKEALLQVLNKERVVHFHTHRADDIVTAIGLSKEFGFELVLHHVSEAWKVADAIADSGVAVSLIVIDSPGGKEEAVEIRMENGKVMEDLGVLTAFHTDDAITDSRLFLRSAALAVRAGMSPEGALEAMTLSGAKMLGLDERVGSLEAGKDGDFVVLSGPPLSVWTHVEQTFVDGVSVFQRSDPQDRLFATGGDQVSERYPEVK